MPIPIFSGKSLHDLSKLRKKWSIFGFVNGKRQKEDIYVAGKFYPAKVWSKLKTRYTWQEVDINMDGWQNQVR